VSFPSYQNRGSKKEREKRKKDLGAQALRPGVIERLATPAWSASLKQSSLKTLRAYSYEQFYLQFYTSNQQRFLLS
jgi:hypothetical protein